MRRLKNFLPIVLIALAVQIFAPIGACWAATIAASDPLAGAVICHGGGDPGAGQADQTNHRAHGADRSDNCHGLLVKASRPLNLQPALVLLTAGQRPPREIDR